MSCATSDLIRDCARRGMSKNHASQVVGISPWKFSALLESLQLLDVQWPAKGKGLLEQRAREAVNLAQRGVPKRGLTTDERARRSQYGRDRAPKYTAFGVIGTLPELVRQFGAVEYATVFHRVKYGGMAIEQALTTAKAMGKKLRGVAPGSLAMAGGAQ